MSPTRLPATAGNNPKEAGTANLSRRKLVETTPGGFEPPISTVTGWHVRPLHHGAT